MKEQIELGRAIARMYIAAQEGVSQHASNMACDAMEGASAGMRFGFNSEIGKSIYKIVATEHDD